MPIIRKRERHIRAEHTEYDPLLIDQNNILLNKKEALEWLHPILNSYKNENLEEIINYSNKIQSLYLAGYELEEKGRYFRFGSSVFKFKKFREDLVRHWSFKCKWCNKKISSKKDDGYYSISSLHLMESPFDNYVRACSESRAKLLWDEMFKNWLKENDLWIDEIIEMAGYKGNINGEKISD